MWTNDEGKIEAVNDVWWSMNGLLFALNDCRRGVMDMVTGSIPTNVRESERERRERERAERRGKRGEREKERERRASERESERERAARARALPRFALAPRRALLLSLALSLARLSLSSLCSLSALSSLSRALARAPLTLRAERRERERERERENLFRGGCLPEAQTGGENTAPCLWRLKGFWTISSKERNFAKDGCHLSSQGQRQLYRNIRAAVVAVTKRILSS
ncbi:hypothetical protein DPMN_078697 [Dreissena polymorpha]|uniref:Uncharacterized protein n=1 Tax=Dreissena polymorpha TaxID=45954 RepID=A0A9D3YPB1_DREPO|nr:hypothetical protein DPMN_078697 [Dreissena polymorpha]